MYTKIKKFISLFLVLAILNSVTPMLSALEQPPNNSGGGASTSNSITSSVYGSGTSNDITSSVYNETDTSSSVTYSVYAVTKDTKLIGSTSSTDEYITIKTANYFPICTNLDEKYAYVYFEISGLDMSKNYNCELLVNGTSNTYYLQKNDSSTALLSYYVSNPTSGPSTYTLKIFDNSSMSDYQYASGLRYLPVDISVSLYEDNGIDASEYNKPEFVNINNTTISYNLLIPGKYSSDDISKASVEMLNFKGEVVALKTRGNTFYCYENQIKDSRYEKIFESYSYIYFNATHCSGDMYIGQAIVEGDYDIRIKIGNSTHLIRNAIKVTNKPIVYPGSHISGFRPIAEGRDDFYTTLSVNGGSLTDFSLHLVDKNSNEVVASSENFQVIDFYNNFQRIVYKMSVLEGKNIKANNTYEYKVTSKAGENSFIVGMDNMIPVEKRFQIYNHTLLEFPKANFKLYTVNAVNSSQYKFELYDEENKKIAEQISTPINNTFTLDFPGITFAKDSHYNVKAYMLTPYDSGLIEEFPYYYYINTYNFSDSVFTYPLPTFEYLGRCTILNNETNLPFEINLLESKYPEKDFYTVTLVNTEDKDDKIVSKNINKTIKSSQFSGQPSKYLNLSGTFILPALTNGKKYNVMVTGVGEPLNVATIHRINNTGIYANYGYATFEGNGLNGSFSIIKNGVEILPSKFTIVLSNVLGSTYEVDAGRIDFITTDDSYNNQTQYSFKINNLSDIPQGWYFKGLKYADKDVISVDSTDNVFKLEKPDLYSMVPALKSYYGRKNTCYGIETNITDYTKPCELWLYDRDNFGSCKKITFTNNKDYSPGTYYITKANSNGIDFSKKYYGVIVYNGAILYVINSKFIEYDRPEVTPSYNTPTSTPTTSLNTSVTPAPTIKPVAGNDSANNISGNNLVVTTATPTSIPTPTATATSAVTPTSSPTNTPVSVKEETGKSKPAAFIFKDIENHWAKNQIVELIDKKIINGYGDSTFKPNSSITRAELAVIIVKALGLPIQNGITKFKDDNSIPEWAKSYIKTAAENGIISGYSDSTFKASQQCTRQEIVTMVIKAFKLNKSSVPLSFKDSALVQSWAKEYIARAIELGIIKGYEDMTFKPNNNVTRAEAAAIIVKSLKVKR